MSFGHGLNDMETDIMDKNGNFAEENSEQQNEKNMIHQLPTDVNPFINI